MTKSKLFFILVGVVSLTPAWSQDSSPEGKPAQKAAAYYHYSLGHLYSELAVAYGNKGDFVDKAIENYRLAMEADPDAGFVSEELSDLYIQAGRLREAVVDAEEALKKAPNDIAARRLLARIYTRLIGDSRRNTVNEGMVKKAIEQYQKIAELEPGDKDVWLMLGRLHKLDQNSLESESAYKKVREIEPENEDALVGLAMVYADLGDNTRAAESLRKVVGQKPSVRTLTFLAGVYEKMDEYALAAEAYRKALELDSDQPDVKRAYAQSLMRAGQTDEAQKVYEELAAEDPEDYETQLRLAQIYRQRGQLTQARQALDAAKAAAPDNLEVQYNHVNLLEAEGRVDEAISVLKEILSSTERANYSAGEITNRAVFLERLGLMYRGVDRLDEAVATFRELEKLDPEKGSRVAAQIADTYRQAKQFDEAYEVIQQAHKKYPEDQMVSMIHATVLADLGRADEAVAAIQALTKGEKDRDSLLTEAQIYEKVKRYDLMEKALDQALELSQTDEEKTNVLFMRGAMYERQKEFDRAEAAFREVLKLDPDNASAMNYMGYMFADRSTKLDEALELITKALEYEPHNGAYLDSLGWVYFRLDRLEEAEDCLRRAAEKVSTDPVVHDHLADVYFSRGKLRQAITHWKKSLQHWEESSASERDAAQVAAVQKKLEGAQVRLAKESSSPATQP